MYGLDDLKPDHHMATTMATNTKRSLVLEALTHLHQSISISHVLSRTILPNIQLCGASVPSIETAVAGPIGSSLPAAVSSTRSITSPPITLDPAQQGKIIVQLRNVFQPCLRCGCTTGNADLPRTDLVERWIFQLSEHSTTITSHDPAQLSPSTIPSLAALCDLCDLFHPLVEWSGPSVVPPTVPVVANEYKLNKANAEDTTGDEAERCMQTDQSADVSITPSYMTLMDVLIELYSTQGLCRLHELSADQSRSEYLNLQKVCSMPHRLWSSWSKNQRPLLQPLLQPHLIPELSNITLAYLLGDESTVPVQIARKTQLPYRWRIPLLEWRRQDHQREYSPEFELDGEKWRVLIFPQGNPNHSTPNCLAGYLELLDQMTYYSVICHFLFRMIHPIDPSKSVWRDAAHTFSQYEPDRGFNDLLTPTTVDEWTHSSDQCVVMEVKAWKI